MCYFVFPIIPTIKSQKTGKGSFRYCHSNWLFAYFNKKHGVVLRNILVRSLHHLCGGNKTTNSVCVVESQVTLNCLKIFSDAQQ